MTRLSHGLLPAIAIAVGALAFSAPAALADQYPRNWEVESTGLSQPVYDFEPGHNNFMTVGHASAQTTAPAASNPVIYQFVPGGNNFHRVN